MIIIFLGVFHRLVLWIPVALLSIFSNFALANHIVFSKNVEMGCFPTLMQKPPCPVPVGIDPALVADAASGKLNIRVFRNNSARFDFRVNGLRQNMVVTAWFVHYRPDLGPSHPIFEPTGPGLPAIAHPDTPIASTWARFSEGLSRYGEPNQLRISPSGKGRLSAYLNYNPLKAGQVPLVNGVAMTQKLVPEGLSAEQPDCCHDSRFGGLKEPIGGSFLREFDPETGFQRLDSKGRVKLVRSPGRPVAAVLFVHIDGVTSGLVPGFPVPPFLPNQPDSAGSVYLLGVFPIGGIKP